MELIKNLPLNSDELELLVKDQQLKADGYRIHYVVDAYDIIEYCFPTGIDGTKKINIEDFQNNLMGYSYLFYETDSNTKPIILDEYLYEINRNRLKFINSRAKDKDFFIDMKIKSADFKNLSDNQIYKKLVDDVYFLTASAVFNKDSVATFSDLMNNRVLYKKPDFFESEEHEDIYKAFKYTAQESSNALIAFNAWFEENVNLFLGKSSQDLLHEFEATFRDFKAIDRIMRANEKISQSKHHKKNVFVYFSNSPRTEKIFKSEYFKEWYNKNPVLKRTDFQILRNIKDAVILFHLNIDLTKSADEKNLSVLHNLQSLLQLSRENDETGNESGAEWMSYFRNAQTSILAKESIRSKLLLNKTLMDKAEEYIKTLENKLNITDEIDLNEHFRKEMQDAKLANGDIKELRGYKNLGLAISMQNRMSDFLYLHAEGNKIRNKQGKDHISGTFHKLPILLFHKDIYASREGYPSYKFYDEVLHNLTKSEKDTEAEDQAFLKKVKDILKSQKINSGQYEFEGEHKLIMIFMMMLGTEDEEIDDFILSYLQNAPLLLEKLVLRSEISNGKLVTTPSDFRKSISYLEFLYFKAWMARRCKEYSFSAEICKEGLALDPDDARFLHGLALIDFCHYIDHRDAAIKETRDVSLLISKLEAAVTMYNKVSEEENDYLIKGTLMSLQNMLLYLLVHHYLDHIINGSEAETAALSLKKISQTAKKLTELDREKYSSHFELELTDNLKSLSMELSKPDDHSKKVLPAIKRDLKRIIEESGKKGYDFDYQVAEMAINAFKN